jgi:hypothetical protein
MDIGLDKRQYGFRVPSRRPPGTLYPRSLALTSPTSGGRSVGIVLSWTQATEFCFSFFMTMDCIRNYNIYTIVVSTQTYRS